MSTLHKEYKHTHNKSHILRKIHTKYIHTVFNNICHYCNLNILAVKNKTTDCVIVCSAGVWAKKNSPISPCIPSRFVIYDVVDNSVKFYAYRIIISDSSKSLKL